MFKISNKISLNLSLVFSAVLFAVLTVMYFLLPGVIANASQMVYPPRPISTPGTIYLGCIGYLVLIVATLADVFLFRLLLLVKRSRVFSPESISCIRVISWAALGESLLFLALAPYTVVSIFICVAAFMLSLSLRVVKNVLEQAMEIKNENDYTI